MLPHGMLSFGVGEAPMRGTLNTMSRKNLLVIWILALLLAPAVIAEPEVVIIGFDGADARLVDEYMSRGELPNLSALRDEGTFRPFLPTNPPQTPVSWSSFATGVDPGRTEIFDFIKRDPTNYLPSFALMTESKRTFMWGAATPTRLALILGAAVLLVVGLLGRVLMKKGMFRLVIPIALALTAALLGYSVADRFLPDEVPTAVNNRQGETMWEIAADAGKKVRVIRVPATFPAEPIENGTMLSGLGVPDMRGRVGTPSYYTSDLAFSAAAGNEFSLELIPLEARRGQIKTKVVGPKNDPFYKYKVDQATREVPREQRAAAREQARIDLDDRGVVEQINLPLDLEVSDTTLRYSVSGQSASLSVGEWSDWVILDFPVNGLVDRIQPLRGNVRFKLLSLEPELSLYMSPIHFNPDCHPVAFSWPPEYSEELYDRFGLYKTMGWALDTWSLPSSVGDEELFLEDMNFTVDKYEEMMAGLLADGDTDLYIQIFYFTDRIGHMLWHYLDTGHPLHDPAKAAHYQQQMLEAYKRMDRIVGKARELAGEEALFMVVSDHGFSSYRRGVNYNNWLREQGLLVLKDGPQETATLEKLFDSGDLVGGIDWTKTQAYAMGLGAIYINRVGREAQGIVYPGPPVEELKQQIKEGLEALIDPVTGEKPISHVWAREDIYSDFRDDLIPDLRVGNTLNYRVSWQTTLGGFGNGVVEDNTKAWTGDHCSNDPSLVPGIFFSSQPINTDQPRMLDMMPTVLRALEIEIPDGLDGRPLLPGN